MENLTLVQQLCGLVLQVIYPLFQFCSQMRILTVVSTICRPCIVSNLLSVVSILLSNGKSNRCFNNILALHCKESLSCFNSVVRWEIDPLYEQIFASNIGNPSVVSILFSNGKSYRCCNNFLALHFKQSIRCLNSFDRWEFELLYKQFLACHNRQSIRCFNSFLKWEIVLLF